MKKISILIPCFNEEENVEELSKAIINEIEKIKKYDYEIIFIDNCSTDNTKKILEKLCLENKKIKAIFNVKNFGQYKSPFYGMLQTTGDCTISMCADFQDPPDLIQKFVKEWENGYKIVIGVKTKSKENIIMRKIRKVYYKLLNMFSEIPQIEQFTGTGLYDKSFINVLKSLDDPIPYLRGIVAELGFERKEVEYKLDERKHGKSKNNFLTLYDLAMLGFTSYTKAGIRIATFLGIIIGIFSFIIGIIYLIMKLIYWDRFQAGTAPSIIGIFFLGAVQLFFIGFLGEYIMAINERVKHRPLVIEEKRINFEDKENK